MYSKDVSATGNLLAAHNFTTEAEQAYQLAMQVCPYSPEAVTGLAQVMAQTGRADQAKALLDQFAAKYPDQSKAVDQAKATIVWTTK
jgi:TolA-binding protein